MKTYGSDRSDAFAKIHSSANPKITGPGASAIKYDILTALLVTATCGDKVAARLATRLTLVISARFNWRLGYFSVGLREIARMWGVTERTAKRDMALLRSLGWISVEKAAVRGRVAQHRIEFVAILRDTKPHWDAVGPDFAARMSGVPEDVQPDNVVPLRAISVTVPAEDGTDWPDVARILQSQDAGLYAAWFAKLIVIDVADGRWTFAAPSRFAVRYIETHLKQRLLAAIGSIDPTIRDVWIECPEGAGG